MSKKNRHTVSEYFSNLYVTLHTKGINAFNRKLEIFKEKLDPNLFLLGFNIVLLGQSGAGKSSFIKSFLASLGLQFDIKISDTQACTTGPASYKNKKYNITFIDSEGNDSIQKKTANQIITETLREVDNINSKYSYPIPTIYLVCNPNFSSCREFTYDKYKYTVDMLKELKKRKLLDLTYVMATKVDLIEYNEYEHLSFINLDSYIDNDEKDNAIDFIKNINSLTETRIASFASKLQEHSGLRDEEFNVNERLLFWSCKDQRHQQYTIKNYELNRKNICFPKLSVLTPTQYYQYCKIPNVLESILQKFLQIQRNEDLIINLMYIIVNQTPFYIRLLTNIHITWCKFLGWFRTESNEDYNDVEFEYDETNDEYIIVCNDEQTETHVEKSVPAETTAAGGGLRERRTAAGGGLNE